MCGLVLTIGLARFAYTPLLPSLQAQTGLNDANAGVLAAINYAGYMTGAITVAWIDDVRWRHKALQHWSLGGFDDNGIDGGCPIIWGLGLFTLCRWLVRCGGYVDGFRFGARLVDAKWPAPRVGFAFCWNWLRDRGFSDWCLGPVDHVAKLGCAMDSLCLHWLGFFMACLVLASASA